MGIKPFKHKGLKISTVFSIKTCAKFKLIFILLNSIIKINIKLIYMYGTMALIQYLNSAHVFIERTVFISTLSKLLQVGHFDCFFKLKTKIFQSLFVHEEITLYHQHF